MIETITAMLNPLLKLCLAIGAIFRMTPRCIPVSALNGNRLILGGGVAFFQEIYLGNFTSGNKSDFANFFTHGFNIGLLFKDIKFTAGYAGRWYNSYQDRYLPWSFPWETFQFTLSIDENYFFKTEAKPFISSPLNKIILSAGVGQSIRVGRYAENTLVESMGYIYKMANKNSLKYFIEAAFYLNENNALVTNFSYSSAPWEATVTTADNRISISKFENINISSSYRLHPIEQFDPLFLEGGVGIQRTNPVIDSRPKYHYRTYLTAAAGANIYVLTN